MVTPLCLLAVYKTMSLTCYWTLVKVVCLKTFDRQRERKCNAPAKAVGGDIKGRSFLTIAGLAKFMNRKTTTMEAKAAQALCSL